MATYTNALIVYNNGKLQKIGSTDALAIGGDLTVGGSLKIQGDIIAVGAKNVLIEDAFLDLGSGYTESQRRSLGFTFNVSTASGSQLPDASVDFTAGVLFSTAPKITVVGNIVTGFYSAGDIIQVSGASKADNNGLFGIESLAEVSGNTVFTLYGVGGSSVPGYALFLQNQVTTDSGNTVTICKVNLAVLAVADGSTIKDYGASPYAEGTLVTSYYTEAQVSDFGGLNPDTGYKQLGSGGGGGGSLQDAYNSGNSITLTSGRSLFVNQPVSGTAAGIRLEGNSSSWFKAWDADLSLSAATNGWNYASKDFSTVGSGAFDVTLRAAQKGPAGNQISVAISAAGQFIVSNNDRDPISFQIVSGVTTVGDITSLIEGLVITDITRVDGLPRVTTATPHGLGGGGGGVFLSAVNTNPEDKLGGWYETVYVSPTSFDLQYGVSPAFTYTGGGYVQNGVIYTGEGSILAVESFGSSGTVLTGSDTFSKQYLTGGTGAGTLQLSRGDVDFGESGISGTGAVLFLGGNEPGKATERSGIVGLASSIIALIGGDTAFIGSTSTYGQKARTILTSLGDGVSGENTAETFVTATHKVGVGLYSNSIGGQDPTPSGARAEFSESGIEIDGVSGGIVIKTTGEDGITLKSGSSTSGMLRLDDNVALLSGQYAVVKAVSAVILDTNEGGVVALGDAGTTVMLGKSPTDSAAMGTFLATSGSTGIVKGNILYLAATESGAQVVKADADGEGQVRELVGVALKNETGPEAGELEVATVPGCIVNVKFTSSGEPTDPAQIGLPVYLSTTAGEATMTAPTSGARVYRVGILYGRDESQPSGVFQVLYLPAFVADLS